MMLSGNRFFVPGLAALVAVLALLMPVGQTMAQSSVTTESEPNNTRDTANDLPIENLTFSGTTNKLGDLDYFRTRLTEGNVIRVFISGFTQGFDGRIQILNADGVVLAEDRRQGPSSTLTVVATITAASPPGIGYIRVSNDINDGVTSSFAYTVAVTQGEPEVEPNDTPDIAQPLNPVFPIVGTYPARQNVTDDFYRFETTTPGETVALSLDYPSTISIALRLELQDDAGEVLSFSDRTNISGTGAAKNPSMVLTLSDPGTYYVKIYNSGSLPQTDVFINYALFYTLRDGLFEQEPNQSFAEAVVVNVTPGDAGAVIGGFLQAGQDVDVYTLVLPEGTQLVADVDVVSAFPVMDGVVSAFLQEDLGNSFSSNDNSSFVPAGASFALINNDPYLRVVPRRAGKVFVAVADRQGRGSATGFEYRLKLKAIPQFGSESEPNNQPGQERRLQSGEVVRGTIGDSGDVDRYVVEGVQGQTLLANLNAYGIGSFLDARVVLRGPSGGLLADRNQSAFSLDPFIILPELTETGDYVIEVSRRTGTSGSGVSYYYELTATLNTSLQAVVADPDVDGSGRVDGFDLAVMARIFGTSEGNPAFDPAADLVVDGVIDGLDLAILGNFFGNELAFGGLTNIVVDTVGDDTPFFGPATTTSDLTGIGTSPGAGTVALSFFYRQQVTTNTGGLISIDSDSSGLTGSLGTPDVYVEEQNLGSDLEVFFSSQGYNVYTVPDPRGDIFPAFEANVGDGRCSGGLNINKPCLTSQDCPLNSSNTVFFACTISTSSIPTTPAQRRQPVPALAFSGPASSSGNQINFELDITALGGSVDANAAALAVSVGDVEPTDRLPNFGAVSLRPPFQVSSISASQLVCNDNRQVLCLIDDDCVEAGLAGPCINLDSLPPDTAGGAPVKPNAGPGTTRDIVYLRTPQAGPRYTDYERSIPRTLVSNIDGGTTQHNDSLDRLFPLGTRGLAGNDSRFEWFSRDLLPNFGARQAFFDPHLGGLGALAPPDQDLYLLQGGEGDLAIFEVRTADDGQTFDSAIELFLLPQGISALDPTSSTSNLTVAESSLVLIARNDDKDGVDKDPRLEAILPATGLYLARVTASVCPSGTVDPAACQPAGATFPGVAVDYVLDHETLVPGEISVPLIMRGPFANPGVAGIHVTVEFDPEVVRMTGFDLAQGLRNTTITSALNPSTAQEIVAERVSAGRVRLAVRSYRDTSFTAINVLSGNGRGGNCSGDCPELAIARLRFRGVGAGTTEIRFADNPTMVGQPLVNLGLGNRETGPVWQPTYGYGPGIQVTVTGTDEP